MRMKGLLDDDVMRMKGMPPNDNDVMFNRPRENDRKIGFVEDDLFYPRNYVAAIHKKIIVVL